MPEIKNNFIQGKMNKDLDDRLLPNGQYRDGINIKVSKSDSSDVGSVQNIKGNQLETVVTPGSLTNADTIGHYVDNLTGDVFWFTTDFTGLEIDTDDPVKINNDVNPNARATNSNNCRIYRKKIGESLTSALTPIVDNFRLNFSKKHPILNINKIDDLLFWTDNYNQPRRISITDAIAGKYSGTYIEDLISCVHIAHLKSLTSSRVGTQQKKNRYRYSKFTKFYS